jgi:hypothetical protein
MLTSGTVLLTVGLSTALLGHGTPVGGGGRGWEVLTSLSLVNYTTIQAAYCRVGMEAVVAVSFVSANQVMKGLIKLLV